VKRKCSNKILPYLACGLVLHVEHKLLVLKKNKNRDKLVLYLSQQRINAAVQCSENVKVNKIDKNYLTYWGVFVGVPNSSRKFGELFMKI